MAKFENILSEQALRNFKLFILFDIELEEPYLSIYNDLSNIFSDIKILENHPSKEYFPHADFYGTSNEHICFRLEYRFEPIIWLDEDTVIELLKNKYNFDNKSIHKITELYINNYLNIKGEVESISNMIDSLKFNL